VTMSHIVVTNVSGEPATLVDRALISGAGGRWKDRAKGSKKIGQ
jgi:hypothetical protein